MNNKLLFYIISIIIWVISASAKAQQASQPVSLTLADDHRGATVSNGLITMRITPEGNVSSVSYANQEMALPGKKGNIYFSYVADSTKGGSLAADTTIIARQSDNLIELIYRNSKGRDGLQWEVGYIMRKGISGYYTYATVRAARLPSGKMNGLHEARIVHRLNPKIFNYAWVSDDNQAPQPSTDILKGPVEKIQDATFRLPGGSIYTKYDYCNYVKDDQLHGMMGDEVGAWLVTPLADWVNGGVAKQELTVHGDTRSPLILQMFQSWHFGAGPSYFEDGQQKMYGPALVYFNRGTREEMIADAKRQTADEIGQYPYQWMQHEAFPLKRSTVKGQIALDPVFGTTKLQVILAQPGGKPSQQGNSYQYWAETDEKGHFNIKNVRPGQYALYAYALNGEATGLFEKDDIKLGNLGTLKWEPEKYGKTLWRIGEADHRSAGFCLSDHRRQYGMFKEVPADLTFTIGKSSEAKDWYYAQTKNGSWDIVFDTDATYLQPLRLTIATAGAANKTKARVLVNGQRIGDIKTDNDSGIYRGSQQSGQPGLYTFDIKPELLRKGRNTLTLQVYNIKNVGGIMYDIIKLEAQQ